MFGRGGGGGNRPVCKFFLEGRCKFGDGCKNEHPQSDNRFSPLQNQGGVRGRAGAFSGATSLHRLLQSSNPNTRNTPSQSPPQRSTMANRFTSTSNTNARRAGAQASGDNQYHLSVDTIKIDLTTDKPQWPLSCYGPGRNAPLQLIEGELEQSPEEMRLLHHMAMARGNPQETAALEAQTAAKAEEATQKILNDLQGAIKFVVDGKDKHPNRIDLASNASNDNSTPQQSQNPFGAPQAAAPSAFGQPAAPSGFGQPAASSGFGQPSAMGQQPSGFGRGSGFGQPSTSSPGFGAPSALGKPAAPGFGAPSSLGSGGSAFGQPSGLGQSPGFGQPSQMGQKPAFGQPAFGQPSKPAFGAPSAPGGFGSGASPFANQAQSGFGGGSPFGGQAAQQQNAPSPFAAAANQPSGFAQPGQQQGTGFGQPSAFGAAANKPSPFASASQPQQQPNPFGGASSSPQPQQSNPFGQPSKPAFGQPSAPGGFGAPSQPAPSHNFGGGQTLTQIQQEQQQRAFGQPMNPGGFGGGKTLEQIQKEQQSQSQPLQPASAISQTPASTLPNPPAPALPVNSAASITPDPQTYLTLNPSTQAPTTFKSHPVAHNEELKAYVYKPDRANAHKTERLWFPAGPPTSANPDTTLKDEAFYTGELGKELERIYKTVAQRGSFEVGVMPEVPPRVEWVRWDL